MANFPVIFTAGSHGMSIRATIKERNVTTGELDVVDMSSATSMKLVFLAPNGETFSKDASLINAGTDGKIGWTVTEGFFPSNDERFLGTWSVQADFVLGTWVGSSIDVGQFSLIGRLKRNA